MRAPIGHMWLRTELDLQVPRPATESYAVSGSRRTERSGSRVVELYPAQYRPEDTAAAHLKFALRYEPLALDLLVAALKVVDAGELERWVRREPTGSYSRRTWFLYETFAGRGTLDVEAIDPARHVVAAKEEEVQAAIAGEGWGKP